MSGPAWLFIIGTVTFAILDFLFGGMIDNKPKLDLEKERRLTEDS